MRQRQESLGLVFLRAFRNMTLSQWNAITASQRTRDGKLFFQMSQIDANIFACRVTQVTSAYTADYCTH